MKVITAVQAAELIHNDSRLWIEGGSGGLNEPGTLYAAVRRRFDEEGEPRNITLMHPNGVGDGKGRGVDLFAAEGLVSTCIGGHFGFSPAMVKLILDEKIKGYNLPQGIMAQLIREIAAKRPGLLTHVGLHTFVDPRYSGGALNSISDDKLVELMEMKGQEYLFYPSLDVDVVFIRGTSADEDGNISMEDEVAYFNMLSAAQAGHNNGIVIAQVKRLVKSGSLDPRQIRVPGILVDYIVQEENQWQTFIGEYDPGLCGAHKVLLSNKKKLDLDIRKVIAKRAAFELRKNSIVNLGFGLSSLVAEIAEEEGVADEITLTIEQGAVGGVPASGLIFGCSYNPKAIVDQPYQFDFYDGGGIDITFLGLAQADASGNVNVSKFGSKVAGAGGFINITQGAKEIVYCGTFTAGGVDISIAPDGISINKEGRIKKFVSAVEQITFSGRFAREFNKKVTFITERAVFVLENEKLILTEIAPGIDLEKDILSLMEFTPELSPDLKEMDRRIFVDEPMGIKHFFSCNCSQKGD